MGLVGLGFGFGWRLGLCLKFTRYRVGFYKILILFHFEALLHNNIFCKHPLYCAIYCTILPVIAPPAQF